MTHDERMVEIRKMARAHIAEGNRVGHNLQYILDRLTKMERALTDIADQPTVQEVEEEADAEFDGDMEYGYDMMIEVARRAIGRKL